MVTIHKMNATINKTNSGAKLQKTALTKLENKSIKSNR